MKKPGKLSLQTKTSAVLPDAAPLVDAAGNPIPNELHFAEGEPDADAAVYNIVECMIPSFRFPKGENLGLQFPLKRGWMLVTMKIPGGTPDDCALVFIRGTQAPPKGTRFAIKMYRPPQEPDDGTKDQGGKTPEGSQGDVGIQGQDAQVVERKESQQSQAGGGDRDERVGAVEEKTPTSEELTAIADELQAIVDDAARRGVNDVDVPIDLVRQLALTGAPSVGAWLARHPEVSALLFPS